MSLYPDHASLSPDELRRRMEASPLNGGRFVCTPETPWSEAIGGHVVHPSAEDDGECLQGCCDRYRCTVCGTSWTAETPA